MVDFSRSFILQLKLSSCMCVSTRVCAIFNFCVATDNGTKENRKSKIKRGDKYSTTIEQTSNGEIIISFDTRYYFGHCLILLPDIFWSHFPLFNFFRFPIALTRFCFAFLRHTMTLLKSLSCVDVIRRALNELTIFKTFIAFLFDAENLLFTMLIRHMFWRTTATV